MAEPRQDEPLKADDRFAVEVRRFVEGRPDPSTNTHDPGNARVDALAVLAGQEQLDSIVG